MPKNLDRLFIIKNAKTRFFRSGTKKENETKKQQK